MRSAYFGLALGILSLALVAVLYYHVPEKNRRFTAGIPIEKSWVEKFRTKSGAIRKYTSQNGFNTNEVFLIDMSQGSGLKRFVVYDLTKDSVLDAGLVTHGRCNQSWLEGRKYGNTVGCGCSSIGRYRIGKSYQGRFGLAYKLHGLDTTNSNAYARFVVLHSHSCVPENEVHPEPICQSDGCPTVSPEFLVRLQKRIDRSSRPVLLWIFEH